MLPDIWNQLPQHLWEARCVLQCLVVKKPWWFPSSMPWDKRRISSYPPCTMEEFDRPRSMENADDDVVSEPIDGRMMNDVECDSVGVEGRMRINRGMAWTVTVAVQVEVSIRPICWAEARILPEMWRGSFGWFFDSSSQRPMWVEEGNQAVVLAFLEDLLVVQIESHCNDGMLMLGRNLISQYWFQRFKSVAKAREEGFQFCNSVLRCFNLTHTFLFTFDAWQIHGCNLYLWPSQGSPDAMADQLAAAYQRGLKDVLSAKTGA